MTQFNWVIVSHNTPDLALNLATHLCAQGIDVHIAATGQMDLSFFATTNPGGKIRVHDLPHNPGYLGAFREIVQSIPGSRAWILSNPDLTVDTKDLCAGLEGALKRYQDSGIIAPRIIDSDHRDQNPMLRRAPHLLKRLALALIHSSPLTRRAFTQLRGGTASRPAHAAEEGATIFAPHGSCMIFTPRFFSDGGSLAYPMFLFGEELWVASELRRLGLSATYSREIVLHHTGGTTTGRVSRGGAIGRAERRSLWYWAVRRLG